MRMSVARNLMLFLPGATNEQSVANLFNWLDAVVSGLGYTSAMVASPNGRRMPGLYHRMTRGEMANFKGCLETLTSQWHTECLNNHYSVLA